ncbi:hypothetical protein [Streptomyces sp. NPDC056452]|uniref:hypothetical protein n=1 Tax=Streptomyces sp. NPDC056452 TaxID=3345821 RepID=UPI003697DAB7
MCYDAVSPFSPYSDHQVSFGTFRGFGANGRTPPAPWSALYEVSGSSTGPAAASCWPAGPRAALGAWDPSVLTTGWSFQYGVGGAFLIGGRNYLAADLDSDGVDDMVWLKTTTYTLS